MNDREEKTINHILKQKEHKKVQQEIPPRKRIQKGRREGGDEKEQSAARQQDAIRKVTRAKTK